eukprot:1158743-Pelagomonas_calceolata.AAC.40
MGQKLSKSTFAAIEMPRILKSLGKVLEATLQMLGWELSGGANEGWNGKLAEAARFAAQGWGTGGT